jgi:hypothetical protein
MTELSSTTMRATIKSAELVYLISEDSLAVVRLTVRTLSSSVSALDFPVSSAGRLLLLRVYCAIIFIFRDMIFVSGKRATCDS